MIRGRTRRVVVGAVGALSLAGCGLGAGRSLGTVKLTVTRDYGARPMVLRSVGDVHEADTVMRVLDRNASISTAYGGGFVQSINGLSSEQRGGRRFDWFFYVNGVESPVGAAAYGLRGGERVWWDYRDWSAAMDVPAVVGSWPEPFADGYLGQRHATALGCMGVGPAVCGLARRRLRAAGAQLVPAPGAGSIRVLVGPWSRLRSDRAAAQIEQGPSASGVFAEFRGSRGQYVLRALDASGAPARAFGASSGLVAATRPGGAPPTWLVTGTDLAGVRAAAAQLGPRALENRYAVAVSGGVVPLPVG